MVLDLCIFLSWDDVYAGESNILDRDFSRKQWFEVKNIDDELVYYKHATFRFISHYLMNWVCLDTHSLQRIN